MQADIYESKLTKAARQRKPSLERSITALLAERRDRLCGPEEFVAFLDNDVLAYKGTSVTGHCAKHHGRGSVDSRARSKVSGCVWPKMTKAHRPQMLENVYSNNDALFAGLTQ